MQKEGKKLYNCLDSENLKNRISQECVARKTISFYSYVYIDNVRSYRDKLFKDFLGLNVLGRVYLASEGVNAQISVPENNLVKLEKYLKDCRYLCNSQLKFAVCEGISFYKLVVKVRKKILSDGLDFIDLNMAGEYLSPEEFDRKMDEEDVLVVDVRNRYESELGYFEKAIRPNVKTFRESLPVIKKSLQGEKDKTILMYCTGGIRCEKASAYLKSHGFKDVKQLQGGIINYTQKMSKLGKKSKFKGSNFVFDNRLVEEITPDVLSFCHQCGLKSKRILNCENEICHLLFIQCESCAKRYGSFCGQECMDMKALPEDEFKQLKKSYNKKNPFVSKLAKQGKGKR